MQYFSKDTQPENDGALFKSRGTKDAVNSAQ